MIDPMPTKAGQKPLLRATSGAELESLDRSLNSEVVTHNDGVVLITRERLNWTTQKTFDAVDGR